jgi:hypothetical protein
MVLVHHGNIQPAIDREEHTHIGGDEGLAARRVTDAPAALKVTTEGDITYVAQAKEGSIQSDAVWQCKKIDSTTGVVITWADGNSQYDNIATDLTALTYS